MHPYGHGGDILTAAERAGFCPEDIVDFSANINPLGVPRGLFEYLSRKLPGIMHYPDPACRRLCSLFRDRYNPVGEILAGNGAGELIYLLLRAVSPGPVLLPVPTFGLYERAALAAGCDVYYCQTVPEQLYRLDVANFCQEVDGLSQCWLYFATRITPQAYCLKEKIL